VTPNSAACPGGRGSLPTNDRVQRANAGRAARGARMSILRFVFPRTRTWMVSLDVRNTLGHPRSIGKAHDPKALGKLALQVDIAGKYLAQWAAMANQIRVKGIGQLTRSSPRHRTVRIVDSGVPRFQWTPGRRAL
jgi:hypothetical protein